MQEHAPEETRLSLMSDANARTLTLTHKLAVVASVNALSISFQLDFDWLPRGVRANCGF